MKIPAARIETFASHAKEVAIALQSVWLDCEGGRLLATDGHMGARVSVSVDDGDVSGLLPREAFDLARKELKEIRRTVGKEVQPDTWLRVACGEDAVVIENLLSHTNHIVNRPKLKPEDKYPVVDNVFPRELGAPTLMFSRELLAILLASIDGDGCVAAWVREKNEAIVFAPTSGQVAAVLMPMGREVESDKVVRRGAKAALARGAGVSTAFVEAADRLAAPIRSGGVESLTISVEGGPSVTIDKEGAENIHRKAQAAKKRGGKANARDKG